MKLCRDCTHLSYDNDGRLICTYPTSLLRTDLVTGQKHYRSASTMRWQQCGPDAALHTPRQGLVRSFLSLLGVL